MEKEQILDGLTWASGVNFQCLDLFRSTEKNDNQLV